MRVTLNSIYSCYILITLRSSKLTYNILNSQLTELKILGDEYYYNYNYINSTLYINVLAR